MMEAALWDGNHRPKTRTVQITAAGTNTFNLSGEISTYAYSRKMNSDSRPISVRYEPRQDP